MKTKLTRDRKRVLTHILAGNRIVQGTGGSREWERRSVNSPSLRDDIVTPLCQAGMIAGDGTLTPSGKAVAERYLME